MIPRPDPNAPATDKRVYGYVADPHAETVNMGGAVASALERRAMLERAVDLKRRVQACGKYDDADVIGWLIAAEVRRG